MSNQSKARGAATVAEVAETFSGSGFGQDASQVSLPDPLLASRLGQWLYGARVRLLRQARIGQRRRVLELGAGWGEVGVELQRRSGGEVTLVDCDPRTLASGPKTPESRIRRVLADAQQLPFDDASFDLVFAQFAFLWIADPRQAVAEAYRVLASNGVIAMIEPDFGGLMEHPPETGCRDVWLRALERSGAHPMIGRELPGLLAQAGFDVQVTFLDRLEPPDPARFDFLEQLGLTDDERGRLSEARNASERLGDQCVAHLPCWLLLGTKTPR